MFFPFIILSDIEVQLFPFVPSSPSGRIAGHKEKINFVVRSKLHYGGVPNGAHQEHCS